jgi:hypothetical protein
MYMEFEESVVKAEEDADLIWVTPFQWNMVLSVTVWKDCLGTWKT